MQYGTSLQFWNEITLTPPVHTLRSIAYDPWTMVYDRQIRNIKKLTRYKEIKLSFSSECSQHIIHSVLARTNIYFQQLC